MSQLRVSLGYPSNLSFAKMTGMGDYKIRCFFVVKFKLSVFMTLISFDVDIRDIHSEKLCDNKMKDSC